MIKVHCNSCEQTIEGPQMAKTGITVKFENVNGAATAHFSFQGQKPDLCNKCLLAPFAELLQRAEGNILSIPTTRRTADANR